MFRFLGHIAVFCLAFMILSATAHACSCSHPYPADYLRSVDQVFDGYVESIKRDESGQYPVMKALIRVERVWKGELPETVIFAYGEADAACQYGSIKENVYQRFFTRGDPKKALGASWCDRMIGSSRNVALHRELQLYADRLHDLSTRAARGGVADKLVFARFLLDHGDEPQALVAFRHVLDAEEDNAAAWLGLGHTLANMGRAMQSRQAFLRAAALDADLNGDVLRAHFEATGLLDPNWKDWSNLRTRSGCKIVNMEVRDATFGGSDLRDCSFATARLLNVDFTGARLYRASFDGGVLRNVTFHNAMLGHSSFLGAEITDVIWSGSVNADFSDARITRVLASDVRGELVLKSAHLADVDFSGSYLAYMDARGARFERVNLTGANLSRAKLQGADLANATLSGANLEMAHIDCRTRLPPDVNIRQAGLIPDEPFCDGRPQNRDFSNRVWEHADFEGLDLRGANFSGSNLKLARFRGADLTGANLTQVKEIGNLGGLQNAVLDGASLDGASEIHDLNVAGLSLKGTTFRGATLFMRQLMPVGPSSSGVDLDQPNFDGAILSCGWDFDWVERQESEHRENAIRRIESEIAAIDVIRAKWPSAERDKRCSEYISEFEWRF